MTDSQSMTGQFAYLIISLPVSLASIPCGYNAGHVLLLKAALLQNMIHHLKHP
jgi:hypothetical protein